MICGHRKTRPAVRHSSPKSSGGGYTGREERGCLWIVVSDLELSKLHHRRPEILGRGGFDGHFVAVGMLES